MLFLNVPYEGDTGVNESILTIMKQIWTLMNRYFLEVNSNRCTLSLVLRRSRARWAGYEGD